MPPWDKYQTATAAPAAKPWERYSAPPATPMAAAPADPARTALEDYVGKNSPPPPLPVTVGGTLDRVGRGFAKGVTNLIGLPDAMFKAKNQAVSSGLNMIGVPEEIANAIGNMDPSSYLFPSADTLQSGLDTMNNVTADTLGLERPRVEPGNGTERFVERAFEELGAAALPVAGVAAKAEGLRKAYGLAAPAAAREAGGLSKMFLEKAAASPGKYVADEMAAAAAAGVGAATGDMVAPDSQIAELIGAVGGLGTYGATRVAGKQIGDMAGALFNRSNYSDDVVRQSATNRIVDAAGITSPDGMPDTTAFVRQIEQGNRISDVVPGVKETLADRTKNPGLAALEYQRQSGPNAGTFVQRRGENIGAIDDAMRAAEPVGNPADLRSELALERDRRLMDADTFVRNAIEDADTATAKLKPADPATVRGNAIRETLIDARDTARGKTREIYQSADVRSSPLDPEAFSEAMDGTLASLTEARRAQLPLNLVEKVKKLDPGAAGMDEVDDIRKLIGDEKRKALAEGANSRADVLDQFSGALDDFIMQNVDPETARLLNEGRRSKFAEAEAFGRKGDPIQRALKTQEGGRPAVVDERVGSLFRRPQDMDRLFAQADTPTTRAAIRDEILSRGNFERADKIDAFIAENAEAIKRFPGLDKELQAASAARATEATAKANKSAIERALGTPDKVGTSTVGKYLAYGDAQVERAAKEIMSSKDPAAAADELLTFVGDAPKAVAGARKAFWKALEDKGRSTGATTGSVEGVQAWKPAAMKRFLDDPATKAVAERFYKDNPEHLDNVTKLVEALQGLDTRMSAKAPNSSGTAQSILPSAETLGSRVFAMKRGQVGGPFLTFNLGTIIARKAVTRARSEGIDRMLDDALLNPDTAALLLRQNNPANRAALRAKSKAWFGNEAAGIMNSLSGEDEEDDVMKAVKQ